MTQPSIPKEAFDKLRGKWCTLLTGGSGFDAEDPAIRAEIGRTAERAGEWRAAMTDGCGDCLWPDLADGGSSAEITTAFRRIYDMALAYRTHTSPLEGDAALLGGILRALEWMAQNRYYAGANAYANWWDWEIGAPQALSNTLMLLQDELPQQTLQHYTAAIAYFDPDAQRCVHGTYESTGANRVWVCANIALLGVATYDSARLCAARDGFSEVFGYTESKDGFYRDGSFIQHERIAYTGGYGLSLLGEMAKMLYLLEGSPWELRTPERSNLYRWIVDSYEPLMWRGLMMDMVRGREIARCTTDDHVAGHHLIDALTLLCCSAPEAERQQLAQLAARWIVQDTYRDFYAGKSVFTIARAKQICAQAQGGGPWRGVKLFAAMDRAAVQAEDYAAGVAMYSASRTHSYESINSENLHGDYTGAGALYLYNSDLSQFDEGYWPTVDPAMLPGITSFCGVHIPPAAPGDDHAGGAVLGGKFGALAMRFLPVPGCEARKSYFLLPALHGGSQAQIVCLGSVRADAAHPARTVLENRRGSGSEPLCVDGAQTARTDGKEHTHTAARWAHVENGGGIGYCLLRPAPLHALREVRRGRWSDIDRCFLTECDEVENTFLSLWLEHSECGESYAYAILPGASPQETAAYAGAPDITVAAQGWDAHAIRCDSLGLTAVNFWQDTPAAAAGIWADGKASAIVQRQGTAITVALADPTQQRESVTLELDISATAVLEADARVRVVSLSPLRLEADMRGRRGSSAIVHLALA